MTLSPPLTVSAILVAGLATVTWLTSVPQIPTAVPSTRVTIELPAAVYTALTLHVKDRRDAQGQPLTVAQWIADLAKATALPPDSGTSPQSPQKQ
jgi:hypothetical protein